MSKKTLILGASSNPARYSYKAAIQLTKLGHEIYSYGKQHGYIEDLEIKNELPIQKDFDTVTLYLNPTHQQQFYNYIIELKPKRVLFNPGTENVELQELLRQNKINFEESCTLVLLSIDNY